MGASHGDFIKYPRTPHLFGSNGTDDDKHLSEAESNRFIADESLIVEEKIDGTNVGIHFSDEGEFFAAQENCAVLAQENCPATWKEGRGFFFQVGPLGSWRQRFGFGTAGGRLGG